MALNVTYTYDVRLYNIYFNFNAMPSRIYSREYSGSRLYILSDMVCIAQKY